LYTSCVLELRPSVLFIEFYYLSKNTMISINTFFTLFIHLFIYFYE